MRSLVVLLGEAAPSFCYYPSPGGVSERAMSDAVFGAVLAFAEERGLALQLVAGVEGLSDARRAQLEGREVVCYVPAGARTLSPEDVPVVELAADGGDAISRLRPGGHALAILRVPRTRLAGWPEAFRELGARVQRVVLVLLDQDRWGEAELACHAEALAEVRRACEGEYLAGRWKELSALSDRLVLQEPVECGAGLDHLTVDPEGGLHLCPGFALDRAPALGQLGDEPRLPNRRLLERACAPICALCDAYHCRRCVYLNRRATLELNTPPWQVCRAAHLERESSRQLLETLKEHGRMTDLPGIPFVSYEEPFEKLTNRKMRQPRAPRVVVAATQAAACAIDKEQAMAKKLVGRVSPEERDEVRELFQRKTALGELFLALGKMDAETLAKSPLYEKAVRDMGGVSVRFQQWWEAMARKYGWEGKDGGNWSIDFDSCDIYLE